MRVILLMLPGDLAGGDFTYCSKDYSPLLTVNFLLRKENSVYELQDKNKRNVLNTGLIKLQIQKLWADGSVDRPWLC